jgi:long-chain acyl-CoA synthetase
VADDIRYLGDIVRGHAAQRGGLVPGAGELIAFCHERLAGYKCPKSVDFVSTLPRTPSGQLRKRELLATCREGGERQVG